MSYFSSPTLSPTSSENSTPSPYKPYSNNDNNDNNENNNEIINKLTNSEQRILIANFYHKLKLVDVQKDIYLKEYSREIGNTTKSIVDVNLLFQDLHQALNDVHNCIVNSLNSIKFQNINNQKKLFESTQFVDYLFRKYPEHSNFDQDTKIKCDSIADIMIDNNNIDLFIQNNPKTSLTSSKLMFNVETINEISMAIPLLCSIKTKGDIINYTNYFNNDEKKLTNTQSQYDLLGLLIPSSSSLTSSASSTPATPQKEENQTITTPLSPLPQEIQQLTNLSTTTTTTTSTTSSTSVPLTSPIKYEQIRSYTREEIIEYLDGMSSIYVAQLTYYYLNLKLIPRAEVLKYINMVFNDNYASANYYVQKLETNMARNANVPPSSISIPYIVSIKQLQNEIQQFSAILKHLRQLQAIDNSLITSKGLNIKSGVYFDESLQNDAKTRLILLDVKNVMDFELQSFHGKFKNIIFNLKVAQGETFGDYNNVKGGSIAYCYKMSYKIPSYNNGNFSTASYLLKVENQIYKSARFTGFINDISNSQIKIKIGKYSLTIPPLLNDTYCDTTATTTSINNNNNNSGNNKELPDQLIDFMFGSYYRAILQFHTQKVLDTGFVKLAKMNGLLYFISPAIFYYIYNHPNKFQLNSKQ